MAETPKQENKMITERQSEEIINAAKAEIRMIMPKEEVETAMEMIGMVVALLNQPVIVIDIGIGKALLANTLPLKDKKFTDVLRVVANMLEATGETERRNAEKK